MIRYHIVRKSGQLFKQFPPFAQCKAILQQNYLCETHSPLLTVNHHLSFFSFFRSKKNKDDSAESKTESNKTTAESEASQSWLEAIQSFEQYELLDPSQTGRALSRTDSRRLKKRAFLHAIRSYLNRHEKTRRGFNQFALNALKQMPSYEVQDDLECYKAIIQLFPTGRMTVTRFLQAEWNHFPRQQNTMIQILQKMTENHVLPDDEVGQMIIDVFGWRSHAMQHYRHLMYWMPKLHHANPWPVPLSIVDDLDENPVYLAQLIAERICPDRMTTFELIKMQESDTSPDQPSSMVSAQSPEQRALLAYCTGKSGDSVVDSASNRSHPVIYLDGPHFVWFRTLQAAYYTLWTELDRDRLKKEKMRVERRQSWITHKTLAGLPQFGHLALPIDRQLDPVPSSHSCTASSKQPLLPVHRPESVLERKLARLDPKKVLATLGRASLTGAQPEYDDRWLALRRRAHAYQFLPNELTAHEQAEGTILAIGVVTPMPDALDCQKARFTAVVSDQRSTSQVRDNCPDLPPVPRPAPAQLLRQWLTQLGESNPGLAKSTLIMRTIDSPYSRPGGNESHEEFTTTKAAQSTSESQQTTEAEQPTDDLDGSRACATKP